MYMGNPGSKEGGSAKPRKYNPGRFWPNEMSTRTVRVNLI